MTNYSYDQPDPLPPMTDDQEARLITRHYRETKNGHTSSFINCHYTPTMLFVRFKLSGLFTGVYYFYVYPEQRILDRKPTRGVIFYAPKRHD